ncbi:hypothetical protein [Pontibacter rugosus]|uniref:Uncharacterized protein n=1 Tax=Pontibacter rugosus TaxID=1745966 RepID=A0ABW3SRN7_9BACT
MLSTKSIRGNWLKYPLMWVMLLWAITMPGHEMMVYDYLVQGSVSDSVLRLSPSGKQDEGQRVQPQKVQAFADADTAPVLVVKQVLYVNSLLLLPLIAALFNKEKLLYSSPEAFSKLLKRVFPVSILPNAP